MFEPVKSWSLPDHFYLVSGWSAKCKNADPYSCVSSIVHPAGKNSVAQMQRAVTQALSTVTSNIIAAWTDVTWLMYLKHVPWAYYVQTGTSPTATTTEPRPVPRLPRARRRRVFGTRSPSSRTSRRTANSRTSCP